MISIIVPVLNEVAIVGRALETLLQQKGDYEVIIADGGSDDGTQDVVQQFPVTLLHQPASMLPGLGCQINRGAQKARGDILVFLHIDVQLPSCGIAQIAAALAEPHFIGGGFVPAYHGPVPESESSKLAAVERYWQARTRRLCWFAGDTAPFVRSDVFWRSGGYPNACFASDWDFAVKLRRLGRLAVIHTPVLVDNRRLVQNGVLKNLVVTGSVGVMYYAGADRTFLRNWYRKWLPRER